MLLGGGPSATFFGGKGAKVFKKYSQMKREALTRLNRKASELSSPTSSDTER